MNYKRISRDNIEDFKKLLEVFKKAFNGEGYENPLPTHEYLSKILEDNNYIVLVAEKDKKVVGGLIALLIKKWEQSRSEMFIYDLAVAEEFRRQGIATGMITKLKEIAKDCGAYVIFVQADKGDDAAIALYESLGEKEEVYHFDIKLN